ncbi:hypothetical protein MSAN_02410800 [Mycena sanguinolenta]|uniref:NB-ARC domain-containing protein n=1 Tax=Mycena sanguinolenta TaxID=230812 RepID=A0A8H6X3C2_9AGAR|nr:hypothetical protein MSAN_02410800 [Mycena sanguinolenta]
MYRMEGGKAFTQALQNIADLVPLPFLSSFVGVGIKVLQACQDASTIEETVKDLQERVFGVVLEVVNSTVASNDEGSVELRGGIETLQSVLADILEDLAKIQAQRRWLLVFFRGLNKDRVDRCVSRLAMALKKFQLRVETSQLRIETSQLRVEDVLARITALRPQLDRIEDAVNQFSQPHKATSHREDMRLLPPIFVGRDALVDRVARLFATQKTSRVCLTGVGGVGKTSAAVAVTESSIIRNIFPKEYIFWVPCITAKSSDLLRRILYTQLRITAATYDSLDPLIAELNESKQPRLLLLDNFETPWLSGLDAHEVEQIIRRLEALPHIALLVTITSGMPPQGIKWEHVSLPALEPAAAREVFKTTYRNAAGGFELVADDAQLDNVLESLGHIPLAITLMATHGGHLGASLDDLLVDWGKAGTEMLSAGRLSMDDTISLSMERGVKSNHNALTLLAILSMLPAGTTGENLLKWWARTIHISTRAVAILRTAAVIEQDRGAFATSRIFVLPTIQSYMSHQNRISVDVRNQVHDACYDFVMRHKSVPDDRKFKSDLEALASEETNIQGLLMDIPVDAPRPNAVDALIAFSFYQSWTKPSTVVASHALEVARAAYDDPHVTDRDAAARRVAAAHECLGKLFLILNRYDEACGHFEEAATRYKSLHGRSDLHCAGEALMQLVRTWSLSTEDPGDLESLVTEAQTNLAHDKNDQYHVARGLIGFGRLLRWSNHLDEVLDPLSRAKDIFEKLDCPASTAECLYHMARTYAYQNEYAQALSISKDALKQADESGDAGLIRRTLRITARYLMVLGLHQEASDIIARTLSESQAAGGPGTIAQALELLAYNCAGMMDVAGARVAYQGAQAQFTKIISTQLGRDGVERCSTNLGMLDGLIVMEQNDFSRLKHPLPMY